MTTNISTSNPLPGAAPAFSPPASAGGLPGAPAPRGAPGTPSESQARILPAAAAGASGVSPEPLVTVPAASSAESLFYFLESARTTSPEAVPAVNAAPPGFEPGLGLTAPSTATAADPRAALGRSASPGQHFGSTAPATPGVELGAQPFAPAVPPASAFGSAGEDPLRAAPAVGAGAGRVSPQPLVTPPASGGSEPLYYFLESVPPTSPRTVPAVNLGPGDTALGPVPDLGLPGPRSAGLPASSPTGIPGGSLYFLEELRSHAAGPPAAASEPQGYRPEIVPGPVPHSTSGK